MLIPEFMYGLSKDVKRKCNKIVTKLKKGASWDEAVTGPLVDTETTEGIIVMHGPNPNVGDLTCFNIYWLLTRFFETLFELYEDKNEYRKFEDTIFEQCLETEWGVLSLFSKRNSRWFSNKEYRFIPFLKALEKYWDTITAEGARYSTGSPTGSLIWTIPSSLWYVLANMNVSDHDIEVTVGQKGLHYIIEKYNLYEYTFNK